MPRERFPEQFCCPPGIRIPLLQGRYFLDDLLIWHGCNYGGAWNRPGKANFCGFSVFAGVPQSSSRASLAVVSYAGHGTDPTDPTVR
jgi:hypothetical protein